MEEIKKVEPSTIIIKEVEELPIQVKNVLYRSFRVITLEDLLKIEYETLKKARNMGEKYLEILKRYVHSLGYSLKGEKDTIEEIRLEKKKQGLRLLEEILKKPSLYLILYRNGIYTLEDLKEYGPKVYELTGYGPLRQQELKEILATIGIYLEQQKPKQKPNNIEILIERQKAENELIKERLLHKKGLLEEYQELLVERERLLKEEQELDQLLINTSKIIKGDSHVKELSIKQSQ